jgi:hypothetical protein
MGSIREDLERVAAGVRGITKHDTEVVIDASSQTFAVYVNFDHAQALVIDAQLDVGRGMTWTMTAMAWDRTGGVSAEQWIGDVKEMYVAPLAKVFLDVQDENVRRLEAMMDERPDD